MESSFYFRDEHFYCEDICIDELFQNLNSETAVVQINEDNRIQLEVPSTPAYVYSSKALKSNVASYLEAMNKYEINGKLGYAVKANGNLNILKLLKSYGVQMLVTVSGNEILTGLKAGYLPQDIIFNGNGKQSWEIKLAIQQGVMLNVDSVFDAKQIVRIIQIDLANFPDKKVKILLRLQPSLNSEVDVHPYINTSANSKFGFGLNELNEVINILRGNKHIQIYGIHCHLGSCILDPNVYKSIATFFLSVTNTLRSKGIQIQLLDIGGGIGINYHKALQGIDESKYYETQNTITNTNVPSIDDFMNTISKVLPKSIQLVFEPGRSIVANAGVIVTKVLGSKQDMQKNYKVVDAAMTELIRPSLYSSFHQIYPTKFNLDTKWKKYNVVGPVCESADFLGKDILLQMSNYLVILDCGAYASSMASNYNMRPKPAEILIDGSDWKYIRKREDFENLNTNIL